MDVTGRVERLGSRIRRILAPNPSPFTYTGTQTYIVGEGEVAVIDPGPDLPGHVEALIAAVEGERVAAILCTHTHRDHSPASRPLAAATGASIVGCAPLSLEDKGPRSDEAFDADYRPDRILADGERLEAEGWTIEAVATPGHTSNHLCLALAGEGALFTGDHVMGWSTSVVAPPDGDMAEYMASLDRLLGRDDRIYYPAHGPAVEDPHAHVRRLIEHRRMRERQILRQLESGEGRIPAMVAEMYAEIDPRLFPAAGRSVLAHLVDLERRGLVRERGERWTLAD
ncbi:MAG TPA: MBL fold metallo-hydrolase [Allosphingosinicella sp.]|jgi:glyoxylase-like metal-dependent hydrolase (beta-lactamase superfamily II)